MALLHIHAASLVQNTATVTLAVMAMPVKTKNSGEPIAFLYREASNDQRRGIQILLEDNTEILTHDRVYDKLNIYCTSA